MNSEGKYAVATVSCFFLFIANVLISYSRTGNKEFSWGFAILIATIGWAIWMNVIDLNKEAAE